jgi:hypothetical protein
MLPGRPVTIGEWSMTRREPRKKGLSPKTTVPSPDLAIDAGTKGGKVAHGGEASLPLQPDEVCLDPDYRNIPFPIQLDRFIAALDVIGRWHVERAEELARQNPDRYWQMIKVYESRFRATPGSYKLALVCNRETGNDPDANWLRRVRGRLGTGEITLDEAAERLSGEEDAQRRVLPEPAEPTPLGMDRTPSNMPDHPVQPEPTKPTPLGNAAEDKSAEDDALRAVPTQGPEVAPKKIEPEEGGVRKTSDLPTLDDLKKTDWKLLRALHDLGATNVEMAASRDKITAKAGTGNHDSKHNQDAFSRLSLLGLIKAKRNVGTHLTQAGIDALNKRSISG